ncbi:cytidylyltransferase domain-containing protein [Desulfonatronovibrio magnus]|uniref:acylneuraminate cytidylyltransferase family protein n=1 Tax=Desulfonatronovibrio magnus TaxID=698827 RepID=UPI0005EAF0F9|nr:acylneuraminate cytidylyltransferase family protein [Desulfonatronovibrio magnus]
MIQGKKILSVIPARGGSKGVPGKNIRLLAGKPLIAWTIEEAKKSKYIDRLVLSSEDQEIISIAKSFGCDVPFVRPTDLAADETPGVDPIIHALQKLPGYDIVVMLQPTSPLRKVEDIDECLEFFIKQKAFVCVSVSEVKKTPYWMFSMDNNYHIHKLMDNKDIISRRQNLPKAYMPNGALFVAEADYLQQNRSFYTSDTLGYLMPQDRSQDIDSEMDLFCTECFMGKNNE